MIIYWRYIFAWMTFSGLILVYMLRVNLSVAIVAMVDKSVSKPKNYTPECSSSPTNSTNNKETGEFKWSESEQTMLLSSFYWGYTIMQIPSGILLVFFRAKWIYGLSTLTTSILTMLIPVAAGGGVNVMVILRFLMGVCEGPTFPALYTLCGFWVLGKENSIVLAIIASGSTIGTIVGQSLTGLFIHQWGWRACFYIMSSFGCVWFIAYSILIYEKPVDHPFISDDEKLLLTSSMLHHQSNYKAKRRHIPWKKILTSGPYISYVIFAASYNFTWYTMINCLPLYIGNVLGFDIAQNGGISSLPYIALLVFNLISGFSQDYIKSKNIISNTKIRKLFGCLGMIASSIFMYCVIYTGCNITLTISLVCISISMLGFSSTVNAVNLLDIAPTFAGPLLAICNVFNSLCGIISPYVKGYYTRTGETRSNWENVFITSSSILFFGALVFMVFGSATMQPWSILNDENQKLICIDDSDIDDLESKRSSHIKEIGLIQ